MQIPPERLSDDLAFVLEHAKNEASRRHSLYLDTEHLMLGLLRHPSGPAYRLFVQQHVDTEALYRDISGQVGMERDNSVEIKGFSRSGREVMQRADREARTSGQTVINTGHLLLALLDESTGIVYDALKPTHVTPNIVRAFLRTEPASRLSDAPSASREASAANKPEVVLVPYRQKRATGTSTSPLSRLGNKPWIVLALVLLLVYLLTVLPDNSAFIFVFVLVGWIFSLCLHEFSHALVAYLGGDYTVKDKGYLTFNPLKYTHPLLSIVMPLLFLAMGGIGLPGGAVYIETHRLRSKWWKAAVSAAGPASNLLLALLLAMPFAVGLVDTQQVERNLYLRVVADAGRIRGDLPQESFWENSMLWTAVALLVMLQIGAVFLNLLPIPPLDGFGIIEPLLDEQTRYQLQQFGQFGLMLVFLALWFIPPVNREFWNSIYKVCSSLGISRLLAEVGLDLFMFWR